MGAQEWAMTFVEDHGAASPGDPVPFAPTDPVAGVRMGACLIVGVVAAGVLAIVGLGEIALLGGWDIAALVYLVWIWCQIGPADPARTAAVAVREDGSRALTDVVLLLAALASLVGVGYVLVLGGARNDPLSPDAALALAIASVVLSWSVVHTIYTLHYARQYYMGTPGGIDFNQDEPPRYTDFAYVAFSIGMTFQVSDTDLRTTTIRATALRHALLSYLFGAVIIAVVINLVAGLGK